MLEFIVIAALLCVAAWWSFYQAKKQLAKYNDQADGSEQNVRKPLTDRAVLAYIIISTIVNMVLMALSYFFYDDSVVYAFKLAVIFQWIIAIAVIDYQCYVIPNSLLVQGLIMAVLFIGLEAVSVNYSPLVTLKDYGLGLLIGGGVFLLSAVISRGSVGMGDVKMFSILGLLMGCVGVFNLLFFTVLCSAVWSIGLLLGKKGDKKTTLPLAPFTYAGMLIVVLAGI